MSFANADNVLKPKGEWTGDRLQRELFEDTALRAKHPALKEAWERYQVLLKLIRED